MLLKDRHVSAWDSIAQTQLDNQKMWQQQKRDYIFSQFEVCKVSYTTAIESNNVEDLLALRRKVFGLINYGRVQFGILEAERFGLESDQLDRQAQTDPEAVAFFETTYPQMFAYLEAIKERLVSIENSQSRERSTVLALPTIHLVADAA